MAEAARQGAIENVRANLPSVKDAEWVKRIGNQINRLQTQ